MQMRTRKPESGNKFYITQKRGGYSLCIQGYPQDANCDVLSNCVGYACGRFNEIIGSMNYPYLNCNAENFIERAISAGLSVANKPSLGGIMVWKNGTLSGNDGAGHVAIVERIDSENQIYTSESSYGSTAFWNQIRTNSNGRWGLSNGYTFRGCIINPSIGYKPFEPTPAPAPTPSDKFNIGDKVIINGPLYTSSDASSAAGNVVNKVTNITRKNPGSAHPYNTTGDLGWMDESSISTYTEPSNELHIGDKVEIISTGNASSYGNSNVAYGLGWTRYITAIYEGRPFPYQVGNKDMTDSQNTTGFYSKSALRKID